MRSLLYLFGILLAALSSGYACSSTDSSEENACFYRGQVFAPGTEFPAADGCNTCTCEPDLSISCTEVACPDADLPDAGEPLDAGDIADAGDAGDDTD
jgi:hypothetical protein